MKRAAGFGVLRRVGLVLVAAGALSPCGAAAFVLTDGGRPASQIVTGEGAPETVRFAARELQAFVEKMSGARLPVVTNAVPGTPSIRLGPAAQARLGADALAGVRRDGYRIAVRDGDLCVIGLDDAGPHTDIEALLQRRVTHDVAAWNFHRGTLYGVYRLLEALGMRWFMPGALGERAPARPTLAFEGSLCENPHFLSRMVGYWSYRVGVSFSKDWEDITIMPGERAAIGFTPEENRRWELRMRGESFRIPLNHNPSRLQWSGRFGETHPEYFALMSDGSRLNGRHEHLCYTDPGMLAETVRDARAFAAGQDAHARGILTEDPLNRNWSCEIAFGDYFSLLPQDGFRQCTCPGCQAAVAGDAPEANQRHSRLVWDFVGRVARSVPELKFTCLAYGSYSIPYPGMEKLPDNVVVGFCAFSNPAQNCYRDTFERFEALLARWGALTGGNMAYWQHYLSSNRDEATVGMPEHLPGMYARTIRAMARYGNHVFCEMSAHSIQFELFNRYLLLKLFYDPSLDEREILQDFLLTFYGPDAGPLLAEIYDDIERKTIERFSNRYAAYSVWERLFDEQTLRGYQERAGRAAALAAGTLYAPAVEAFRDYYLGLMLRGRLRYADPLGQLLASFNPVVVSRAVATPPAIDGAGEDAAWRQADSIALGNTVNGRATQHRTEVRSCHDAEHVYFLVNAALPGADGAAAAAPGAAGPEEGIAIYLDAPRTFRGYCRIAVDRAGAVRDFRHIDDILLDDPDWRSQARAAVGRSAEGYVAEVAVPWRSLGLSGADAAERELGVLVVRNQASPPRPEDRQSTTSIILRGAPEQPGVFNQLKLSKR